MCRSTRAWFQQNNIDLLDWSALSLDINPVENIWGYLVRKVYHGNKNYPNNATLKAAITRKEPLDSSVSEAVSG